MTDRLEAYPTLIDRLEAYPTLIDRLEGYPTLTDRLEAYPTTQHRGLVERAAIREADGFGPSGFGGVGIIAADVPVAAAAVEIA